MTSEQYASKLSKIHYHGSPFKKRLPIAQEAGANYAQLAYVFEAASTEDLAKLDILRGHESRAVRFATFCNPLTLVSSSDLSVDPLIKFAAIFNPATPSEILDEIGFDQTSTNPIILETIEFHKNASKEFKVFKALSDIRINEELYDEEDQMFFTEAIFDDEGNVRTVIDLESLEALFYLHILGFIDAPAPTNEFWDTFLFDSEPKNLIEIIELFGSLPAIPESLNACSAVVGARCFAGELSKNSDLIRALAWDKQLLSTGVGGFYWQDSRSPRSSIASNEHTPEDLLRTIFKEESKDISGLGEFPHPVLWRLSCNPKAPEDVIDGIISLIEQELVTDELTQSEILVGELDDFPYGLITNPAVKGPLRIRVEALMRERDLDPSEFEINQE
jgi:hypothetical protein